MLTWRDEAVAEATRMEARPQTVLENLRAALRELLLRDERVVLLGEDIAEPYGGAFQATAGLAPLAPERVLPMPISEEGFTNMAAGMALMGYRPVVDLMFSDFMALAFDSLLNFASKSVTMFGRHLPLQLIVRAANGGYRGYGATHSQSMQKHVMGIPNLAVYELSPFHDALAIYEAMFARETPCVCFEEKTLYASPWLGADGRSGWFQAEALDENWVRIAGDAVDSELLIVTHGGLSRLCLEALEALLMDDERDAALYVPACLYPLDLSPLLEKMARVGRVLVVEEGTRGANWSAELLAELNRRGLLGTVRVAAVSAAAEVIPAARREEARVLPTLDDVVAAARQLLEEERP